MKIGVFVGSFDPITLGHLDIISRATRIFDQVIVAIGNNVNKMYLFSVSERVEMIKKCTEEIPSVKVMVYDSLTAKLFKETKSVAIIRGIRNSADLEFETSLYFIGKKLDSQYEVVYFPTSQEYLHISSGYVKELIKFKGDYSMLVPQCIIENIKQREE